MRNVNPFLDNRKIPKLSINVKVKIKTDSAEETNTWNSVFGYIIKKPRTKLEFLMVSNIRNLSLKNVTLEKIKEFLSEEDYTELKKIEKLFNERLTTDLKAFILSILRIPINKLKEISENQTNALN